MAVSEKGLTVGVYRGPYESTNGGQSSKVQHFTVVGIIRDRYSIDSISPIPPSSQVFAPTESAPAAILRQSALRGAPPHLIPLADLERSKGQVGPMAGGNLADDSDSRWGDLVSSFLPSGTRVSSVDIHDRVETQAEYDALSR